MARESNIKEFRVANKLPINEVPQLLSSQEEALHLSLIEEELEELYQALDKGSLVDVFDALIDLRYVVMGFAVHMGLPMSEGERIVHDSNMSKLGADGEPVLRSDGKVLKGPNWWPAEPHLEALLEQKCITVEN